MDTVADSNTGEFAELNQLQQKINNSTLPSELEIKAQTMIDRAALSFKYHSQFSQFDIVANYIDWITALPWDTHSVDKMDIEQAKIILDKNHYGLMDLKDRILEYLSVMKLNIDKAKTDSTASHNITRAPILFFVGLVGTGKTTMAISIAEAMGRKFVRIPFGGMGSALQLRGKARAYPGSEPGQVIKVLRRVQTKNPVILLDEIDRVTDESRADIMGVLVEVLDLEQNSKFLDQFIDYPFDLSEILFIATANNTRGIATAVLDRVEFIEMPSYTDEQKITIGKDYLLPRALASSGLSEKELTIDDDTWDQIVRPLGFDAGMRTLDRTINAISRKVAKQKLEGKIHKVAVTAENLKEYLPA